MHLRFSQTRGFLFWWLVFMATLATGGAPAAAQITVPTITTQPQSLTINPGSAGSLTVVAAGTGTLGYRWFKNGSPLADGSGSTGTSTATLSFGAAQGSDAGSYTVVVSTSGGNVTSDPAIVTVAVISAPVITSTAAVTTPPLVPVSYAIEASNSPARFSATGLPFGLTLDSATGVISGTPLNTGIFTVSLGATNDYGTGGATLLLTVEARLPSYADKLLIGATGNNTIATGKLSLPSNLAVDAAGNIYVADTGAHVIVKITASGSLSLVAGQAGQGGSADGVGIAATFLNPGGVAADANGNLYVADTGNHTIRKISPDGRVSRWAGAIGQAGSADGSAMEARFFSPQGIVADTAGTLYVADTVNHTIRKITAAGVVTTLTGSPGLAGAADGDGSTARFNLPNSLALDRSGALYVADGGNGIVRKISTAGEVTTLSPAFNQPSGIAVDPSGNIFVSETNGDAIKEITAVGTVRKLALNGVVLLQAPPASPASFPVGVRKPRGMACDASGNFYWFNLADATQPGLHKAAPYFPVTITSVPVNRATVAGTEAQFSVTATGSDVNYAWYGPPLHKSGGGPGFPSYLGSTGGTQTVTAQFVPELYNVSTNAGTYGVFIYNIGSWARASAELSVIPPPPRVASQPAAVAVMPGQSATFTVVAARANPFFGSLTYVWSFNGTPIPGATDTSYTISQVQAANAGTYEVTVTESSFAGVNWVTSAPARLSVGIASPVVMTPPQARKVYAGNSTTLSVAASGDGLIYQWRRNGTAIAGATSPTLTVSEAQLANAGEYTVVISNQAGSVTTAPVNVEVITTRLINLSARGDIDKDRTLIVGFVTAGSASKQLLVRGIGPALEPLRVSEPLRQLQLTLFDSHPRIVDSNSKWGGTAPLITAFASTGAFGLPTDSNDAALSLRLPGGLYSAQLAGVGGSAGIGLAEIYDADGTTSAPRLINLSARGFAGTGDRVLIAGFVIAGNRPGKILLRGIGPTLSSYAVSGVLAKPQLMLFDAAGKAIAHNVGWGGGAEMTEAFAQAGAFELPANSRDSALLVTLPAGGYTAVLSGEAGSSGIALVEIYEVPE